MNDQDHAVFYLVYGALFPNRGTKKKYQTLNNTAKF
jgi:hypothetical protein